MPAIIRQNLIHNGFAHVYYEPERQVSSELNDDCILALVDQWFIDDNDATWKQEIEQISNQIETCSISSNPEKNSLSINNI
jgi:leucyl-tRNA synthetase